MADATANENRSVLPLLSHRSPPSVQALYDTLKIGYVPHVRRALRNNERFSPGDPFATPEEHRAWVQQAERRLEVLCAEAEKRLSALRDKESS